MPSGLNALQTLQEMTVLHPRMCEITERIEKRSAERRARYLRKIENAHAAGRTHRSDLGCGNLAHGMAACPAGDKARMRGGQTPNLAIITAYNDMLSAHQPYGSYPEMIRQIAREAGATAQVAGGVPAMCDGITQGRQGMELSLFSRDVIAMSTAIALSHDMFDAALYLGICDKIVPGLLIAALAFGHLPAVFVPAGPMRSGLPNEEKTRVRKLYAQGKASRAKLLRAEAASYHSPGTCTFYGTANSNQMLMEIMGLHMPGASFANPGTALRDRLTQDAVHRALAICGTAPDYLPIGRIIDARAIVNGVVGLHATGGSTNHTLHLVAIAAAAGIELHWQDIADLSQIVPLITRIYPGGNADINHFNAAGGMGVLIGELMRAGLLHRDVLTVNGTGLDAYEVEAMIDEKGRLARHPAPQESADRNVIGCCARPFRPNGGLALLKGNLGDAILKTSALKDAHLRVAAPARVFVDQDDVLAAFQAGELDRDVIIVLPFQGPRACGMPELHKLTPPLSVLLDKGYQVGLVTDGRMSGASGRVPAAIHLTPEAANGGMLARLRDDDMIVIDALSGTLEFSGGMDVLAARPPLACDLSARQSGLGRELFGALREAAGPSDLGAHGFGALL